MSKGAPARQLRQAVLDKPPKATGMDAAVIVHILKLLGTVRVNFVQIARQKSRIRLSDKQEARGEWVVDGLRSLCARGAPPYVILVWILANGIRWFHGTEQQLLPAGAAYFAVDAYDSLCIAIRKDKGHATAQARLVRECRDHGCGRPQVLLVRVDICCTGNNAEARPPPPHLQYKKGERGKVHSQGRKKESKKGGNVVYS